MDQHIHGFGFFMGFVEKHIESTHPFVSQIQGGFVECKA